MVKKILLLPVAALMITAVHAQKNSKRVTAYAITSEVKGSSKWAEVKLVDLVTGEELQPVYQSKSETQPLNARTKKPIEKKDMTASLLPTRDVLITHLPEKKMVTENSSMRNPTVTITSPVEKNKIERKVIRTVRVAVRSDAPFATNSAACAFDKKHDRLYYTPMGINQLRYIDLKTGTIYYFENEPLGALSGPGDTDNQVTRMTIGSDGNGYALTNSANHLIQFTTNKKAVTTDLGPLSDDASNGNISVHDRNGYGGDMVADKSGNLYLVTANHRVFKINIGSKVATFAGRIQGLPNGFSTNGAAVESERSIVVTSATNASAYYKFSLDNMQAEKISTGESVFNGSDLANGNLISDKKKKKEAEKPVEEKIEEAKIVVEASKPVTPPVDGLTAEKISVYPNPVTNGVVKISFSNYQAGTYQLQLVDQNGKIITSQITTISSKMQVLEYNIPAMAAKGAYLLKIFNSSNKTVNTERIMVQ
ncbi:MAG TPA: T9SS type A sorting domain-containing protein [Ferruginibacter sp.]|nr:T9SS type A sorting domain-containing protein [Ferruginibacter sp.]